MSGLTRPRAAVVFLLYSAFAFDKSDTELFVRTQVAQLEGGAIKVPNTTSGLIVEIGCSDVNTADETLLPKYGNGFLISFEPMIDKYAVLLNRAVVRYFGRPSGEKRSPGAARNTTKRTPAPGANGGRKMLGRKSNGRFLQWNALPPGRDRSVPLGHHHQRGVVLPFAVSLRGGPQTMHISKVAGCSSLLDIKKDAKWAWFCQQQLEKRVVDTLSVEQMARLLPPLPIHYFKLDAQGLDIHIILALRSSVLKRIETLTFEAITDRDDCATLYQGQKRCSEIEAYLHKNGFEGSCQAAQHQGRKGCEVNPTFTRPV